MKRFFFSAFFIFGGAFSFVPAQTPKKDVSQIPATIVEPFKIARGSSFSASVSRPRKNFVASENAGETKSGLISRDFNDALDLIRENYVGGERLDDNELTKSAVTSMLRTLDPHSNFYDAKDYQELLADENSEYSGIGASIADFTRDGETFAFVTSAFADSPASRAGLRFGDKIVAVGGESMANKSAMFVREKIRGGKGTIAHLTVERAISGKTEAIDIRRSVVAQPSIPDAYLLRSGIGYIDLTSGFNYTTSDEISTALKGLHEQGINSLILDLRDNPGGILEQAVRVAEKFLSAGQTIVSQRGRGEFDNRTWKSINKNPENVSLVVLVNGGSASASEIVTGALQDSDRALVIGEKTFGKGLVQSVIDLPSGAGLTLTTAKYYTPSGRLIQRDYEHCNLYDYFQRRVNPDAPNANAAPSKTVTGRNVYGGDGIAPDETVKTPQFDAAQIALLDPLFFFARELACGRIKGFENYKINRPVRYGQRVRPDDFPASAELVEAFKNYPATMNIKISAGQIETNRKFISTQLRYELATAAFGNIAANQVLIEEDVQVARAVDALPRAENLALAARRNAPKK